MMWLRDLALLVLAGILLPCDVLAATDRVETEQVKVQLLASVTGVHGGEEIQIGIRQQIIPHWHTYWINPGDSGLATKIDYQLPAGAVVGEIQWPTPRRISLGPVVNYGYDNEVTLLSSLKLPERLAEGDVVPIRAKAKWLVCEEACIPQEAELELRLPVLSAATQTEPANNDVIAQALSSLPLQSPWPIELKQTDDGLLLSVVGEDLTQAKPSGVYFYPQEWGRIAQGVEQSVQLSEGALTLKLTGGDAPLKSGDALKGVLAVTKQVGQEQITQGFKIDVVLNAVAANAEKPQADLLLPSAMLFALLGGLALNLMPCVFPVLSMKALALVGHAGQSSGNIRRHGWAYTAGILVSFAGLALLLTILKAGGAQIGWGFQFQSPVFVVLVAYLTFVVGLSLSGVFVLGASVAGVGSSLAQRGGYTGSFCTGMLATVVATPCTAPFMGAAIGFALTQTPAILLSIFLSLGFGLALPYLLLSYWPRLQTWLPRPGPWMERFKQLLAFPMYGASVWLCWVLTLQVGAVAVPLALTGMLLLAFAAWLFAIGQSAAKSSLRRSTGLATLVLVSVVILGSYIRLENQSSLVQSPLSTVAGDNWEPFSMARLHELRAQGRPVFVNFTAAWCISCLVNERVALSQVSVKQAMQAGGISYLKGDWTNQDAEITAMLAQFGRSGVPLYLYYPPGQSSSPSILPQILTPDIVIGAIGGV